MSGDPDPTKVGQNPLAGFVVRLLLRVEAESTTGSQRP